jgi:hypothetical protein
MEGILVVRFIHDGNSVPVPLHGNADKLDLSVGGQERENGRDIWKTERRTK